MFLEQPLKVSAIYRIKHLITSHVFDPIPSRAVRPSADNLSSISDLADISSIKRGITCAKLSDIAEYPMLLPLCILLHMPNSAASSLQDTLQDGLTTTSSRDVDS